MTAKKTNRPVTMTDKIREMLKRDGPLDSHVIGSRCGYQQTTDVSPILCHLRRRGEIVCVKKGNPGRYGDPSVWDWAKGGKK